MFYFPDLNEQTRLNMLSELELDIRRGLFYEPSSMNEYGLKKYRKILGDCFMNGNVESIEEKLSPAFFLSEGQNGRKIPSSIRQIVSFNDFNRYYVRALLVRALNEDKKLCIYRAKKSLNERQESKMNIGRVYSDENQIRELLDIFRDYRKLFANTTKADLLKPNSGLSLRIIES